MQDIRKLIVTDVLTKTLLREDVEYKVEEHGIKLSDRHVNPKVEIEYAFPSPYEQNYSSLNNSNAGPYFANKLNKSRKKNKAAKKARRLNRKK